MGVVSVMRAPPELGLCLAIQTYSDCLPRAISDFAKALCLPCVTASVQKLRYILDDFALFSG